MSGHLLFQLGVKSLRTSSVVRFNRRVFRELQLRKGSTSTTTNADFAAPLPITTSATNSKMKVLPRITVEPSEAVRDIFGKENYKQKDSPGNFHINRVTLPTKFLESAETVIKGEQSIHLGDIQNAGIKLQNQLKNRRPPIEEQDYVVRAKEVEEHVLSQTTYMEPFLSENQKKSLENQRAKKIHQRLKRLVYHWEPINFTKNVAYEYLVGRTAGEYAALYRIFNEIAQRDRKFQPQTLFDFGSGLCSVVWAANQFWGKSLTEHMCIDMSDDMTNLADLILRRGSTKFPTEFQGVFFRRLLPTSAHRKYDLTVCSHTLFELSSLKDRIETLDILWKKTNEYLVLVEQGTNAGFKLLNEARDYIIQAHDSEYLSIEDTGFEPGHVFSPCPHELKCPRLKVDSTPCNFSIRYERLMPFSSPQEGLELFTYMVFKKGLKGKAENDWPRIVRPVLPRGGHVVCRLCTKHGEISEAVITKSKHSRQLYRTARKSSWGDLLPVDIVSSSTEIDTSELEIDDDNSLADNTDDLKDSDSHKEKNS